VSQNHSDTDVAGIGVEPDDMPTRFLTILAAFLTAGVVLSVLFVIGLFKLTVAAELKSKGYAESESARWSQSK
jgi:hypothetical protein